MGSKGLGARGWGLEAVLVMGLVLTVATPCLSQNQLLRGEQSELKLAVRIYNYAQTPGWTLARAEKHAAEVFLRAGVDTVWSEEPMTSGQAGRVGVGDPYIAERYFTLMIVTRQKAGHLASDLEPLGFAMPCSPADRVCRAYIFNDRVEDLARHEGLPLDQIFGYVIAHEMGHLLLGPRCHTTRGIMRGMWGSKDLRYISRGVPHFTPGQAELIRARVHGTTGRPEALSATQRGLDFVR